MSDDELMALAGKMARKYKIRGWTTEDLAQEFVLAALGSRDKGPTAATRDMMNRARDIGRKDENLPVPFTDLSSKFSPATPPAQPPFFLADDVYPHLTRYEAAIVRMKYEEGLTDAEIGVRLNKTEKAVERKRTRILEKLRGLLGKLGISEGEE